MINATFRPIDEWPGELTKERERSQFSASWERTLQLLDHELKALGAEAVVVKLALTDRDIRLDGWPRAKARPEHPGVIVEFDSLEHGWLTYRADKYDDWHDNIRAIALTLEALRAVERWGALRGEQYQGSRPEIEAGHPGISAAEDLGDGQRSYTTPSPSRPARLTPSRALIFLEEHSGTSLANADRANLERAYRQAALRLHPDQGGDPWLFARLQEARTLLLPPERSRR